MGKKKNKEEEFVNIGSEFDRYQPPTPKVYKLSSTVTPENLTASFQNLLNKRISDNYKVRKRQNLQECFTILKFTIIFIIFITTCKIITLFFGIKDRIDKQYNKSSYEAVQIYYYLIFTFALTVQIIEIYAIIFENVCLTFVFTTLELIVIIWAISDNYHSKDEHWLIFLWIIGILIFIMHLIILYKMKFKNKKKNKTSPQKESIKEMGSESSDQSYNAQSYNAQSYNAQSYNASVEEDCSFSDFLKKQSNYNQLPEYNQSNIDMPNIGSITRSVSGKEESTTIVDPSLVKFVDDEEAAHEKREKLCKELLRECQMKIYQLEISQCNNQLILDQQSKDKNSLNDNCNSNCSELNSEFNSNQTSELNSPYKLSQSSSSCSDETCKEASKIILNRMNNL